MKHVQSNYSCTIVSLFVHSISLAKRKPKNPKYPIFSVISVPLCTTRPTKMRISVSQLYPKLRSIHKKGRFHDTPVQLVQNVHRFDSCAIGQVMLHSSALCAFSTEAKTMAKNTFRRYLRLTAQRTWNQDGLLRDPIVSQVTHYPQITKFP